jgi:hypothetical protein
VIGWLSAGLVVLVAVALIVVRRLRRTAPEEVMTV